MNADAQSEDTNGGVMYVSHFPRGSGSDVLQSLHCPWMRTQETALANHDYAEGCL